MIADTAVLLASAGGRGGSGMVSLVVCVLAATVTWLDQTARREGRGCVVGKRDQIQVRRQMGIPVEGVVGSVFGVVDVDVDFQFSVVTVEGESWLGDDEKEQAPTSPGSEPAGRHGS